MPKNVTAEDIDQAAARLDIQLTDWQRELLVDVFANRNRTGRWPYLHLGRRNGLSTIARVGNAALAN